MGSGYPYAALILADTGNDTIVARASVADVFAVMSFKGSEVFHCFKTANAVGAVYDVLNLSGRNITSFSGPAVNRAALSSPDT